MHYPIVVFGVKDVTRAFVEYLNQNVCKVDLVVTISEEIPKGSVVSGYGSMDALRSYGTEVFHAEKYGLKDERTRAFFAENTFDLGISMNWSRIIPANVLHSFKQGIFGLHGSRGYLPYGQGRATLNWSLIDEAPRFVMHMFRLDEGVDAPDIYDRVLFEVNAFDTIRTLQYKDLLASETLATRLIRQYQAGLPLTTVRQTADAPTLYPGRKPEDGRIDIKAPTKAIYNLVRAVTKPFPGAFCYVKGEQVTIWDAQPFDSFLDFHLIPTGTVIAVFDGKPLIRTTDGSLLIHEYECNYTLQVGDCLE